MAYSPTTQALLDKHWTIDAVMVEWTKAQEFLAAAKVAELAYRTAVFEVKFPNAKEGTQRVELGNGYFLKAVAKTNYNLDKDISKIEAALTKLETIGNEGKFLADRIVKWSADLVISEYRKLAPQYKTVIDTILTTSPGTPTIEIEAPKTK